MSLKSIIKNLTVIRVICEIRVQYKYFRLYNIYGLMLRGGYLLYKNVYLYTVLYINTHFNTLFLFQKSA